MPRVLAEGLSEQLAVFGVLARQVKRTEHPLVPEWVLSRRSAALTKHAQGFVYVRVHAPPLIRGDLPCPPCPAILIRPAEQRLSHRDGGEDRSGPCGVPLAEKLEMLL